jgi:hypothetical protein
VISVEEYLNGEYLSEYEYVDRALIDLKRDEIFRD